MVGGVVVNWFYNYGGESHAITLRPYVPIVDGVYDGKYVAIRHDGQPLYTPLTATNGEAASDIPINFGGQTFAVSSNPDLLMNRSRPRAASACTLIADKFDFGIDGGDGKDYYTNMSYITATRPNSTIYGNTNANTITLAGGEENLLAGGIAKDTYVLRGEDALIVDFGIGVQKLADGTSLTDQSDYANYNRFDTGTFEAGNCVLEIYGTVTGIYFDGSANGVNKYYGVFDVAVVYDNAHVVLLKNIVKSPHKTSDTPSVRFWDTNTFSAGLMKVYDCSASDEPTVITGSPLTALFKSWDDFPVELRPKLIRLYQMYDESDFTCSAVDLEVNHQVVPDDLRYPTRDDSPIDMLDGRTLNGIKNIFNKGLGSKYFRVGDYFDITFAKSVTLQSSGVINAGSTWRAVCLGIDHNPEIEGYNRGHFAIGRNTDNVEIAFATRRMNATGTNAGGWGGCEMRTWLNSTFYDALPSELKAVISPCTKYTDNVGGSDSSVADNVTATVDNLWFLAVFETGTGAGNTTNLAEQNFQQKYEYYANGASLQRHIHSNPSGDAVVTWRLRSPGLGGTQFKTAGGVRYNAATALSFVPCFTIGGDSD